MHPGHRLVQMCLADRKQFFKTIKQAKKIPTGQRMSKAYAAVVAEGVALGTVMVCPHYDGFVENIVAGRMTVEQARAHLCSMKDAGLLQNSLRASRRLYVALTRAGVANASAVMITDEFYPEEKWRIGQPRWDTKRTTTKNHILRERWHAVRRIRSLPIAPV
jgi:hypothetical protein